MHVKYTSVTDSPHFAARSVSYLDVPGDVPRAVDERYDGLVVLELVELVALDRQLVSLPRQRTRVPRDVVAPALVDKQMIDWLIVRCMLSLLSPMID